MNRVLFSTLSLTIAFLISSAAWAKGGMGDMSLGLAIGMTTASQDDFETYSQAINALAGRNASKPGSALEASAFYEYRFSSTMFALQFRPSYFTQEGKGNSDKVSLTGFTLFPLLRMYPLENAFIKFYLQGGLGYGKLDGKVTQPTASVDFSGSAFGAMAGLGADFCFTPAHCLFLEGNFRYLPFERNLVSSVSGTPTGFSRFGRGQELEINSADLKTTMSGIIGNVGYQMNF